MKAKSMVEAGRKKMNKKFSELEDRFFFLYFICIFFKIYKMHHRDVCKYFKA